MSRITKKEKSDGLYKALLLLTNAVHWFNPLVWWMVREASRNLELCCDDEVVRAKDAGFRRRYGEILLHTAAGCRAPALSTYFGGGKKLLKGRLANLFHGRNSSIKSNARDALPGRSRCRNPT